MISFENSLKLIEIARKRVEKDRKISEHNKKLILFFLETLSSQKIKPQKIYKYAFNLVKIARMLGKPLNEVTELDIQSLIDKIVTNPEFSERKKHDYKVIIKRFYKWLSTQKEDVQKLNLLKTTINKNQGKLPDENLSLEEVQALANASLNYGDRGLMMHLYEYRAGTGEYLSLKLKNVEPNKFDYKLTLFGKTSSKPEPLNLLKNYLTNRVLVSESSEEFQEGLETKNEEKYQFKLDMINVSEKVPSDEYEKRKLLTNIPEKSAIQGKNYLPQIHELYQDNKFVNSLEGKLSIANLSQLCQECPLYTICGKSSTPSERAINNLMRLESKSMYSNQIANGFYGGGYGFRERGYGNIYRAPTNESIVRKDASDFIHSVAVDENKHKIYFGRLLK